MPSQGMNKVILIGHVDGAPRFRSHSEGRHRLWMRLRTSEMRPDENGEMRERRGWHTVIVWGARAKGLNEFLRVGHRIALEGRLVTRKLGLAEAPRWETEIHARELIVLDGPRAEERAA